MWRPLARLPEELQAHFRLVDLLDIAIVAVLLYVLLVWLTRTASRGLLVALLGAFVLFVAARLFGLYMTTWLFQAGFTVFVLALILVFQADIRRAFEQIAAWATHRPADGDHDRTVDVLIEAAKHLADRRTGALVVLKGRELLGPHVRGGIPIFGTLSLPLLSSIFDPNSPGHDGAVIVEGDQIIQFGAHLPLSTNLAEVGGRGMRHTAALGLAERTDALVIIVSEERGTVSLAHEGTLTETDNAADIRNRLELFHEELFPTRRGRSWPAWFLRHPGLKAAALLLAFLGWTVFVLPRETRQQTFPDVPVAFSNLPEGWRVVEHSPMDVQVTVVGAQRDFRDFDPLELAATLDLAGLEPGVRQFALSADNVNVPEGMEVTRIEPRDVRLEAWPMQLADLRIRVPQQGRLPDGLKLQSLTAAPATIPVLIRRTDAARLTEISTNPVDLSRITADTTLAADLDLPESVLLPEDATPTVRVTIDVEQE